MCEVSLYTHLLAKAWTKLCDKITFYRGTSLIKKRPPP